MATTHLSPELLEVASRIKELREICEVEPDFMAKKMHIALQQYLDYEEGRDDIPISAIYSIAKILKTDSTTLLTGEGARMVDYTVVRSGNGISIERYPGYSFSSLAINFIGRDMDPMIVTLAAKDGLPDPVTHGGQEFNYVLEGTIAVVIGEKELVLNEGDSVYFNPRLPHGQYAKTATAKFLTVINE